MDIPELIEAAKNLQAGDQNTLPNIIANIKNVLQSYSDNYNKLGQSLYRLCEMVMKIKEIRNQIVHYYEQIICLVIKISINCDFRVGYDALRFVFNFNVDYYKTNNVDPLLIYPIGKDRPLETYEPQITEQCDVVKPYITSTSYCGWTRCTVLEIQNNKYTLRYANNTNPNIVRQKPWFAPLGTRTKDFQWRYSLKVGSQVQALLNRVWYKSTVTEIGQQNGSSRVRITYRRLDQNGDRQDSQGKKYFGLGPNQDEWIDILSSRIQQCGKMVNKKFCHYTFYSQEILLQDTYDNIFEKQYREKPFYAITRVLICKSLSMIKFINTFVQNNGLQKVMQIMKNSQFNDQIIYSMLSNIGIMVPLFPSMFIRQPIFVQLYKNIQNYFQVTAKTLNPYKIDMGYFCYDTLGRRIFSLSEVYSHQNQLKKVLVKQFLKMNMEKQMLALRYLNDLIAPKKQYSTEQRQQLNRFLVNQHIFQQIFNSNTHEQIISRTANLLQYMIQKQIISQKQFQNLWKIFPATDLRGRSVILKLVSQISKTLPINYTNLLIQKILSIKQTELTIPDINLLRDLKNCNISNEYQFKILTFLWDILTVKSSNVKNNIQQQIQKVFKATISTIKDSKIRMSLLQSMINKLQQCKKIKNEIQLLKDFIMLYPRKIQKNKQSQSGETNTVEKQKQTVQPTINNQLQTNKQPQTIYQAVTFLKQRNIYEILLNLLFKQKQQAVKKDLLKFLGFIFDYDSENITQIIKNVYVKIGPTVNFLRWVRNLLPRSSSFVQQLLQNDKAHTVGINEKQCSLELTKFQKLSLQGFQFIQAIILCLNSLNNNLKLIKANQLKPSGTVFTLAKQSQTSTSSVASSSSIQDRYYVNVLVSPFKLIGIKFLQNLLQVVKQEKVYNRIIRLIIHFMSNFDSSIQKKTQQYRKQFLNHILQQIKNIIAQNIMNDRVKLKVEVYVNLLTQIFGQTQKQGIGNIQPYNSKIQGEKITLNIQNLFKSTAQLKLPTFKIVCNQNITIWKLKKLISQIINQRPQDVDIIKYSDPMSDTNNGKSLSQLLFYDNQKIKIDRKKTHVIHKVKLLNDDKSDVGEKFLRIIIFLFNQYKNKDINGIGVDQFWKLSSERWKGTFFKQKQQLNKIIQQYDHNKKGYLSLQNFKQFILDNTLKNQSRMWRAVNLSGFKNDLSPSQVSSFKNSNKNINKSEDSNNNQNYQKEEQKQANIDALPRRILSCPQVYHLIFSIFQNDTLKDVQTNFYRLLSTLQINKTIIQQIQSTIYKVIKQQQSIYTLCYFLQVAISELSKRQAFYYEFWENNGISIMYNRLQEFLRGDTSIYEMDSLVRYSLLPAFLKIFNLYLRDLCYHNLIARFISHNKINTLQPYQFGQKISSYIQEQKDKKNLQQDQIRNKLKEKVGQQQIQKRLKQIYTISSKMLHNIIKNFNPKISYLQRLVTQIFRILGQLIVFSSEYHSFQPYQFFNGIKNGDMYNRKGCAMLVSLYLFSPHEPNVQQIQQVINKMIQQIPTQGVLEFENYFSLLIQVISRYLQINMNSNDKDQYLVAVGNRFLDKLMTTVKPEPRIALHADKLLFGILSCIEVLLKKQSVCKVLSSRKLQITQKCLFNYQVQQRLKEVEIKQDMLNVKKQGELWKDYVICKSQQSRKVAYNIVVRMFEVCNNQNNETQNYLDTYILPVIRSINYDLRFTQQKDRQVGLKNFGSTCYMNSMLQVLNSVKPFRNLLMKCNSDSILIKQLKKIFAALFFSQRKDYAPGNLLTAFVPPINPGIQQDTTQFLNLLFDQLQIGLSQTKYKKILDQIFKGANTVQMICHSCGYKKQNRQQFFSFGVQIQGKNDLSSALQGSYQGEVISDYMCDSCKNKSQTTKRNLLSQIPNILFIHLRRIVFNYDMFVNMKIHTRLQFPKQLNIEPYTKEGVELREKLGFQYMKNLTHNQQQIKKFEKMAEHGKQKDFYKLKLKGVIVHSGSADVGHYYSIIQNQKQWYKYDDSRVSYFPESGFDGQCYGGTFISDEWGTGRSTNAYVLIYQKQIKTSLQVLKENTEKQQFQELKYDEIAVYNSPEDYKQIWLENHNFMLETQLIDVKQGKDFTSFVESLIKQSKNYPSKLQLISQMAYRVSFHSGFIGNLLNNLKQQQTIALINPSILYNYIMKDKIRTFKILFSHERYIRQFMAHYISYVIVQSYIKGDEKTRKDILELIHQFINSLPLDVAKNWMRMDGYLKMLLLTLIHSASLKQIWDLFIQRHLISTLIDFIMQKQSPIKLNPKNYSVGSKTNPVQFYDGVAIILFLLRHSYGFTGQNYEVPTIPQGYIVHLNDNDVICLSHMQFYRKMIRQRQNLTDLAFIIHRLCINNLQFSKAISEVVLSQIGSVTNATDEMRDLANICYEILKINDQFWLARAQMLLGSGYPSVINNNLINTYDEQRFAFACTLYDIFPVQCLLSYIYLYRLKNTLGCFQLIRSILQSCSMTEKGKIFLLRQPSPTYLFNNYLSWVQNFVQIFISYVKVEQKHKQLLEFQTKNVQKLIQELRKFEKQHQQINYYHPVITGQIANKTEVFSDQKDGIQIKLYQYDVYCKKNIIKNGCNPEIQKYLQGYRLSRQVKQTSNILKFFRKPGKAIALKLKPIQQQEDKQLFDLFDQSPYPSLAEKKPQVNSQKAEAKKQIKIEKQEIQKEKQKQIQINLTEVFFSSYMKHIQIINRSKSKKIVKISLRTQQNPNFTVLREYIFKVIPNGNESIWISKQNPQLDWGKVDLNVTTQQYNPEKHDKTNIKNWWFKVYGYPNQPVQQQLNTQIPKQQNKDSQKESGQDGKQTSQDVRQGNTNPNPHENFGGQQQINCPVCTFFNPLTNTSCQACGSPMYS